MKKVMFFFGILVSLLFINTAFQRKDGFMNAKNLLTCLIILAVWMLVPLHAIADLTRRAPQPAVANVAPQQIDTSKIAVAKVTSKPPTPEPRIITRSSKQRGDGLTTAKWQAMRAAVAKLTNRSVQTMPTTVNFAQSLSAKGDKITITPRSLPPGTSLRFRGSMDVWFVYDGVQVCGQQGTFIMVQFPVVSNAIYLASCTGVFETDYEFHTTINRPPYILSFSGHAKPQTDNSTQMIWIAPGNLESLPAYLTLRPSGLAPVGSNGFTEAFLGCDILRVQ